MISLDWLAEEESGWKKLIELIKILESISDEELYSTPFIEALKVQMMLRTLVIDYCVYPFSL